MVVVGAAADEAPVRTVATARIEQLQHGVGLVPHERLAATAFDEVVLEEVVAPLVAHGGGQIPNVETAGTALGGDRRHAVAA